MSDLSNPWPSWGESGELPPDGFFYEGGDQVNEKHLDSLWNTSDSQTQQLIDGITERVADIVDDVILDTGLDVTQSGGTREVDVSGSVDGAYVNGQQTGSTIQTTLTFSVNGGSTDRIDSVWVNESGSVGKTEGTQTVASDRFKIAEVTVAPNDTISNIANVGRRLTQQFRSDDEPDDVSTGDIWTDTTANRTKAYQNGDFRVLVTDQDSATIIANDGLSGGGAFNVYGGSTSLSVSVSDFAGTHLSNDGSNNLQVDDDFVLNTGDTMGGALNMGDNALSNAASLTANDFIQNAVYQSTGDVPALSEGSIAYVSGDGLYVEDGS